MSDIGVWRQGEPDHEMIVIRLWGSERQLTLPEANELIYHLEMVVDGIEEYSAGDGYRDIPVRELDHEAQSIDLVALGLSKPKPELKRRSL